MTSAVHPMRVGFLGVGKIAREHARAVRALGHRVAAGCATRDSSPRWLEFLGENPEARYVSDETSLLMDPGLDAVVVCLPWDRAEASLPRLLSCSKPILLEKPIALSSAALQSILRQSPRSDARRIVGYNRRFYSPVRKLRERLAEGGLKSAEILICEAVERLSARYGPRIIENIPAFSSSHFLDTAIYLLGELRVVRAYRHPERGYAESFFSVTAWVETRAGTPVTLAIHADNPASSGIRMFFDDRTVWHLSPLERLRVFRGFEVCEPTAENPVRAYGPILVSETLVEGDCKPGFLEQMRAFLEGEGFGLAARPEESVGVLSLIETLGAFRRTA